MQILALMTEAFGSRGGIQEFNRHWLRALAELQAGQAVRVLVTAGGDHTEGHIRQRQSVGKLAYLRAAWRAAATLTASDLILCGHLQAMPVAALAARRSGAAVWLQLHGIEAWDAPDLIRRRACQTATLVTAVSRYTRRRYLSWANFGAQAVRILTNTVRGDCLEEAGRSTDADLAAGPGLLSVGRLDASESYKGHDRVIEAMPEILQRHPSAVYKIAGEGSDLPRLQALARRLNVARQVLFLGAVDRARLLELYRTSRLFVMPSTGEGFGIVFLEALACGCPVVGLGTDGSADPLSLPGATRTSPEGLTGTLLDLLASERPALDNKQLVQRFGPDTFRHQVELLTGALAGARL